MVYEYIQSAKEQRKKKMRIVERCSEWIQRWKTRTENRVEEWEEFQMGTTQSSFVTPGKLRMQRVLAELESLPRLPDQKAMHTLMVNASAQHIYGTSWEAERLSFMRERRLRRMPMGAVISAARRAGKSICAAMFMAVMLRNCPIRIAAVACTFPQVHNTLHLFFQSLHV